MHHEVSVQQVDITFLGRRILCPVVSFTYLSQCALEWSLHLIRHRLTSWVLHSLTMLCWQPEGEQVTNRLQSCVLGSLLAIRQRLSVETHLVLLNVVICCQRGGNELMPERHQFRASLRTGGQQQWVTGLARTIFDCNVLATEGG